MNEVSKAIDSFLREHLFPVMKVEGFKRKNRRFARSRPDRIDVMMVESSRWNNTEGGSFFVGLGIYIPEIAGRLGRQKDLTFPYGGECGIYTDIGGLMPCRHQLSWDIDLDEPSHHLGFELKEAVMSYALPWYKSMELEENLVDFLESKDRIDILALYFDMLGNDSKKVHYIKLMKESEIFNDRESMLSEWLTKVGLDA